MKYLKGLLFASGALLILSACQTRSDAEKSKVASDKISIKHLAEDDPKTQLAQVVANSLEFHAFEYRLPKEIKSYQVYEDHFENGKKIETQLVEAALIEEHEGLLFFNLSELATVEDEEESDDDVQRYYFTRGSFSKKGSTRVFGEEELKNPMLVPANEFQLDVNGTYPLLAFKQTNKYAESSDDTIISLQEEFLYEPERVLKETKDLSKILLYRIEFSEKRLTK